MQRIVSRTSLFMVLAALGVLPGTASAQRPDILWIQGPQMIQRGNSPYGIAFSPDGGRFALTFPLYTEVRRTSDQQVLFTLPTSDSDGSPLAYGFSADGQTIVTGNPGTDSPIKIWDADDGTLIRTVPVEDGFDPVGADLNYALASDFDSLNESSTVRVRRIADKQLLYTEGGLLWWKVGPDPHTLTVVKKDGTVRFLQLEDGSALRQIPGASLEADAFQGVQDFSFSPDGTLMLLRKADRLDLRSAEDGHLVQSFPGAPGGGFSPGGHFLMTAGSFWVRSGDQWVTASVPWGDSAATFSPDGRFVATTAQNEPVRLWRVSDGQVVHEYPTGTPIGFTPDGEMLVIALPSLDILSSGRNFFPLSIWRTGDGGRVDHIDAHRSVLAMTFSPDSRILATAGEEGAIRLWDAREGTLLQTWEDAGRAIRTLAFSPDGATLTAERSDRIRTWRVSDGQLLRETPNAHETFSPDGRLVAVSFPDSLQQNTVEIRRADDRSLIQTFKTSHLRLSPLGFTPDGRNLVIVVEGEDDAQTHFNNFEVWSVDEGQPVRTLTETPDRGRVVNYQSDGKLFAVVTSTLHDTQPTLTYTLSVYDVASGQLLKEIDSTPDGAPLATIPEYDLKYLYYTLGVRLYSLLDDRLLHTFDIEELLTRLSLFQYAPEQNQFIAADFHRAIVWSMETGQKIREFDREVNRVGPFTYSPDGLLFAYLEDSRELIVAANPNAPVSGDVNADRQVDVTDAVLTLQFITGITSPDERERRAADMSGDDQVTVSDVILILRKALGIED